MCMLERLQKVRANIVGKLSWGFNPKTLLTYEPGYCVCEMNCKLH
jgi:hypothetical protein